MPGTTLRLARSGDEAAIFDFLAHHRDSSLYLRHFLSAGGLVDAGEPLQGTYAVALDGAEVVGLAMHNWQGLVFLQAPDHAAALSSAVVEASKRTLVAVLGPFSQVEDVHRGLGKDLASEIAKDGLFALNISDLIGPDLGKAVSVCRVAQMDDLALLLDWRIHYDMESNGLPDTESLRDFAKSAITGHLDRAAAFILKVDGQPVSLCTRTARAAESIQIGGVWTPPELRSRRYGRAVVAGVLREAARDGVTRAVLFTGNPAAQRSYEALGFRQIGDYGIAIYSV